MTRKKKSTEKSLEPTAHPIESYCTGRPFEPESWSTAEPQGAIPRAYPLSLDLSLFVQGYHHGVRIGVMEAAGDVYLGWIADGRPVRTYEWSIENMRHMDVDGAAAAPLRAVDVERDALVRRVAELEQQVAKHKALRRRRR